MESISEGLDAAMINATNSRGPAGDKAGRWKQWYDIVFALHGILIADDRFDEWLESEEE